MNSFIPKKIYYQFGRVQMFVPSWTKVTERLIYIQGKMHNQLNS